MTLKELQAFNDLLLQFQKIERAVYVPKEDRQENDVEHSYQLAMLAWYIVERDALPLDKDLVLRYALIHDLVEVYAGDTFFYGSEEELASKKEREEKAAKQLREDLPEFAALHTHILQYEEQKNEESRFVRALDKIVPMLNIYADGGRTWQKRSISLEMLIEKKRPILAQVPELEPYFEEFVALLAKRPELFKGI